MNYLLGCWLLTMAQVKMSDAINRSMLLLRCTLDNWRAPLHCPAKFAITCVESQWVAWVFQNFPPKIEKKKLVITLGAPPQLLVNFPSCKDLVINFSPFCLKCTILMKINIFLLFYLNIRFISTIYF